MANNPHEPKPLPRRLNFIYFVAEAQHHGSELILRKK
jgi:hypothetical protein